MNKKWYLLLIAPLLFTACTAEQKEEAQEEITELKEELTGIKNENIMLDFTDKGGQISVFDIEEHTLQNTNFRTTIWTGKNIQMTLMSIPVGGEIGLEVHDDIEQFLRIESGEGLVMMGDAADNLSFQQKVGDDDALFVPMGKWHNIKNIGDEPLKLYSIYGTPEHAKGTVHVTMEEGHHHHH